MNTRKCPVCGKDKKFSAYNKHVENCVRKQRQEPLKGGLDKTLLIDIEIPADATPAQIINKVVEVVDQADTIHRANGGRGLKVKGVKIIEDAPDGQ